MMKRKVFSFVLNNMRKKGEAKDEMIRESTRCENQIYDS